MGVLMEELSDSRRLALVGSSDALALRYEPDEAGSSPLFLSQSLRSR